LAFGAVAVALGLVTVTESLRLHHAQTVNAAVAAAWIDPANAARATRTGETTPAATRSAPTVPTNSANAVPEARLARAVTLARFDYDGALGAYKAIIQGTREDLRRIALYDLGNLHLRQALKIGLEDEAQSLPLLELAKQSYRDLLRRDPNDWDARYNLERTLRLAPESDDDSDEDTGPPDPREHERSTIADPRMDLP
jgi:mxaK protein